MGNCQRSVKDTGRLNLCHRLCPGLGMHNQGYYSCCLVSDMLNQQEEQDKSQALYNLMLARYIRYPVCSMEKCRFRQACNKKVNNMLA